LQLSSPTSGRGGDASWLFVGAATLFLVSPLRYWWAADNRPWFLPFFIWFVIILLARLFNGGRDKP
jgi:hypothetical protein